MATKKNKKYELTDETKTFLDGTVLHRIRALRDFSLSDGTEIKAGDLGGWIEKESNLSHNGKAWVGGNAWCFYDAVVKDDACVLDNAMAYGNAQVFGNARVFGDAQVFGEAQVFGDAFVYDSARVSDNARVSEDALVFGTAVVSGYENVCGHRMIPGYAHNGCTEVVSGNDEMVGEAIGNESIEEGESEKSDEKKETVDDILEKMRNGPCFWYWPVGIPQHIHDNELFKKFADRIEAALKREREAGAEAAKIREMLASKINETESMKDAPLDGCFEHQEQNGNKLCAKLDFYEFVKRNLPAMR